MPSAKPVLPPLKTPMSATFPSELSRSPLVSATFIKQEEDLLKTPITPPVAYTDFLKFASPTSSPLWKESGKSSPTSQPSTADSSNCSCSCDAAPSPKMAKPTSPFSWPMSAPAYGPRRFRIPVSPLCSPLEQARSPLSATVRSPMSIISPKDFDFSVPRFPEPKSATTTRPVSVRQVVTRTVTYTPRTTLDPAPKGKRRKVE
ncbi:MAG: hypothetical protein M1824_000808 [Vezdaea acicularis]|nr:MAG: hypothetical protein M1824_000808 [Vezdaea acicularis]